MIGAGIFGLFSRARLGAYIGFFVPIIAVFVYVFILVGWRFGWQSISGDRTVLQVAALTMFAMTVATCGLVHRIWKRRSQRSIPHNPISD